MQRLRLYARLMRLDKPIGIWLTFFPAAWSVALAACHEAHLDWSVLVACMLGAILVRSAGCIVNDLTDRNLDTFVARTASRPLASGEVKPVEAFALLGVLLALALAIVLLLPPLVLWLALAALPLIAAYPWMKRIVWWPQAFLGLTFNLGALIGWTAVTGSLALPAWLIYSAAIFWTFGYDTIYALQDAPDDATIGIKSSARWLGRHVTPAVIISYGVFLALLVWAGLEAQVAWPYYAGLALALAQLGWQVRSLTQSLDPGRLFRSNQWAGLVIFAGAWLALYV